jgi:small subunit ribosomal protein S1
MSWKRVKHPSELVKLGDEIQVKILRFDREKNRVSLGLKQLAEDPWQNITRRYPVRTRLFGKVTNITDYGLFVEIEPGIEGLVHMSEIDWTNKNINPAKVVSPGQEVEVMVLEIDPERRRISLGMKQCASNPWAEFATTHNKGDKVVAKVKSITDFGLFLGLDGNIDGLVHLSDISWAESGEQAISTYKKGQEVEAVILAVDAERERISLGIKQLQSDNYSDYLTQNPKGTVIKGKVTEVNAKHALVELENGIVGKIKAADASRLTVKDVTHLLAVGDEIEAKVLGLDKKSRQVTLSIRELQPDIGSENAPGNTQLGDLLKEQMENVEDEE